MITALALSPALDVSYLVNEVVAGNIHRPGRVVRLAGGKALNVARAATTLGARALVIAPLGGHIGALVAELAVLSGIDLEVIPVDTETRLCISAIPAEGAPTEFYESPPALTAADWRGIAERLAAAPATGWTVLSGRLPPSVPRLQLAAALLDRRARGDRLAIDGTGAELAALLRDVAPDLVKLNRSEAVDLVGADAATDLAGLAGGIRRITGGTVVLTDGAAGALALGATGAWRAAPDPEPGPFAIGSGDSFLAGLLVALERSEDAPEALRAASAAGSANTRVPGAAVFSRSLVAQAQSRLRVALAD